jgi:hypothetical protein
MQLHLTNSKYRFSYYKNIYSADVPDGEMDINDIIEIVKYGYLKNEIHNLRLLSGTDYDKAKLNLPAVTLSGTFSKRNGESIIKHSGLIQVDIDDVQDYEEAYFNICHNEFTYLCFKSPGGKGIKVIVKILADPTTHVAQFNSIKKYYQINLNIEIDKSCKDIARCMLLSYDPEIYCNPFSIKYEGQYTPPPIEHAQAEEGKAIYQPNPKKQKETIEKLLSIIEEKGIDITENHSNWIKIGYALCDTFGENGRGYFHRISQYYNGYSHSEADKTYSQLFNRNDGRTKFGSLLYVALKYNLKVK